MTFTNRIEVNPKVMLGKPVIRGTRIPVELLLRKLSEGASEAHLLDAYPRLTRDDIRAAIRYAIEQNRRNRTLAHKGNIQKYTEGQFMKWGYELAKREFGDKLVGARAPGPTVSVIDTDVRVTAVRPRSGRSAVHHRVPGALW